MGGVTKKWRIPALMLALMIGVFVLAAWWMADSPGRATSMLPLPDPTGVGASMTQADVELFEMPTEEAASEALPATLPAAEPPPRTASPFFWMAAGAACASLGILFATRTRHRSVFGRS